MTSQLRPEKFSAVLQLYGNVLPSVRSFDVDLDLWQNKWSGDSERATELDTPTKCCLLQTTTTIQIFAIWL